MKFKLGDKVIIIVVDRSCRKYKNKIGVITETDRIKRGYSNNWDYEITFDDGFVYPFSDNEMRTVANRQLLFDFMEKK